MVSVQVASAVSSSNRAVVGRWVSPTRLGLITHQGGGGSLREGERKVEGLCGLGLILCAK